MANLDGLDQLESKNKTDHFKLGSVNFDTLFSVRSEKGSLNNIIIESEPQSPGLFPNSTA
jgi:hypothetical protein